MIEKIKKRTQAVNWEAIMRGFLFAFPKTYKAVYGESRMKSMGWEKSDKWVWGIRVESEEKGIEEKEERSSQ